MDHLLQVWHLPVPDAPRRRTFLINLDAEPLLTELVEHGESSKPSSDQQRIHFWYRCGTHGCDFEVEGLVGLDLLFHKFSTSFQEFDSPVFSSPKARARGIKYVSLEGCTPPLASSKSRPRPGGISAAGGLIRTNGVMPIRGFKSRALIGCLPDLDRSASRHWCRGAIESWGLAPSADLLVVHFPRRSRGLPSLTIRSRPA